MTAQYVCSIEGCNRLADRIAGGYRVCTATECGGLALQRFKPNTKREQSNGVTGSLAVAESRLTRFCNGTSGPYSNIAADIRALIISEREACVARDDWRTVADNISGASDALQAAFEQERAAFTADRDRWIERVKVVEEHLAAVRELVGAPSRDVVSSTRLLGNTIAELRADLVMLKQRIELRWGQGA
jgi:hypothetical protein